MLVTYGKNLLQHATARFVYDLNAYQRSGKPIVVAAILREEHYRNQDDSPVQLSSEYSNGIGQVVMKKAQAEPGKAKQVTVNTDGSINIIEIDTSTQNPEQLRWIGNGRAVLNNKGNPVKQYEPYFSVTHQFEDLKELVESGVTPIMYYDALGRLIKTGLPDGTFSRTEFDSWKQIIFDPNDTLLESDWYKNRSNHLIDAELLTAGKDPDKEKFAAEQTAKHANTPTTQHFDTLGRSILSVEHNRSHISNGADEFYFTQVDLDIEGNLRKVTDARGNVVMQYKYDMLGNKVYQQSMDAGQRWLLINCMGNPLRTWDERKHEFQYFYDILHRPTHSMVIGGDGGVVLNHIFERIFYGEDEPDPESKNLRGQIVKHFDTGGVIETPEYDFKGQPKSTTRKLFKDYKGIANWLDANLVSDLETDNFTFITETDALARISQQSAPDGSIITPQYNKAGLLNAESLSIKAQTRRPPTSKTSITTERQAQRFVYGNDVVTEFTYDKETFRLIRLETKRQNGDPLQDWCYTYDPVGNITHIEDKNSPVVFFDNQKITSIAQYTYDALYRLVAASGRENNQLLTFDSKDNWNDAAYLQQLNPGDPMAMRNYTQCYQYDAVGNILQMKHQASGNPGCATTTTRPQTTG